MATNLHMNVYDVAPPTFCSHHDMQMQMQYSAVVEAAFMWATLRMQRSGSAATEQVPNKLLSKHAPPSDTAIQDINSLFH